MSFFNADILHGKFALSTGGDNGMNPGISRASLAHCESISLFRRTQEQLDRVAQQWSLYGPKRTNHD